MDKEGVKNMARDINIPGQLRTPEEIDEAIDRLVTQLLEIAAWNAPRRKDPGKGRKEPWWNWDINEAKKEIARIRRVWL